MFKVHVVDETNRAQYREALKQHHRLRHTIYVEERRWTALARPDGREVDQFDTPAAVYLLGIDSEAGVVAGSRLVPTLEPHLMSDVFPELAAARGLPRAPDIYEWTRIFVAPAWRECGRPCQAAGVIYAALVEFALSRSIRQLSVVCETYWISRLVELGWRPRAAWSRARCDRAKRSPSVFRLSTGYSLISFEQVKSPASCYTERSGFQDSCRSVESVLREDSPGHVQPLLHHQGTGRDPSADRRDARRRRQPASAARRVPGLCGAGRPHGGRRRSRARDCPLGHAVAGLRRARRSTRA